MSVNEGDFQEVDYETDIHTGQPQPVRPVPVDDEARRILRERQGAYVRVFAGARQDDVQIVMDDLAKFCRGYESVFDADPNVVYLLLGRQEVFQRIVQFAKLNNDELFHRYHARQAAGEK